MDETGTEASPSAAGPGRLSRLTYPVRVGTDLDLPSETAARIAAAVPENTRRNWESRYGALPPAPCGRAHILRAARALQSDGASEQPSRRAPDGRVHQSRPVPRYPRDQSACTAARGGSRCGGGMRRATPLPLHGRQLATIIDEIDATITAGCGTGRCSCSRTRPGDAGAGSPGSTCRMSATRQAPTRTPRRSG